MNLPAWTEETAYFSDPDHRVWLRRRLSGKNGPAVFVLHNPSKASVNLDDPTSRRGIAFANAWGCSDLVFVNAATGVATDAKDLDSLTDPIGALADEALRVAAEFCRARDGKLIAAWGAPKGTARGQRRMYMRFDAISAMGLPFHYLRLTPNGYPEHILYLPGDLKPQPWRRGVFA